MTKRPLDRTKVRQSVLLALFLVLVALQVLLSYEVEEGFSMRQILTMGVGIALYALFALSLLGVYAARRREVRAGRALALLQAEKDALEQQLNERAQAEQAQQEAEAQEGVQRDELVARLGAAEGPDLPQEFFRIVAERWQLVQGLLFARQGDDLYGVTHTYAYYAEDGGAKPFRNGETLTGQVVKERTPLYLSDLPKSYRLVASGLGRSAPKHLYIIPLVDTEGQATGAVELAFFCDLREVDQRLIANLAAELGLRYKA